MKIYRFLLIISISFIAFNAFNQNLNGINFQAVAKDQNGNIGKNKNLYVTTSILKSDENGEISMKEAFVTKTDNSGIFSIILGKGKIIGGKFSSLKEIEWNNDSYFLNIQMAIVTDDFSIKSEFTGNLINLGTTKFGTVPSAISADFVKGFELKLNIADSSKYITPTNLSLKNVTILNTSKEYTDKKLNEISVSTLGAEPFIKTGTNNQYFRGDKTFQILDKNAIGLTNIDNTSDINKPVSAATQLAINNATAGNMAGNANTATKLATPRTINGVAFDGTSNITIAATSTSSSDAITLTGTTLASNVVSSSLTSVGNLTAGGVPYSLLTGTIPTWNQNTTGNAATATTATTANSATTATTATKLANARTINGVAFDGTTDITITGTGSGSSDASTLTGTTLASNVVSSSLTSVGNLTAGGVPYSLLTGTIPTWNQNTTGNAATATTATTANSATTATTATKLANARTINGVAFDGTADITITGTGSGSSDAGTLTGTTLASNVVSSSLTSVGNLTAGGVPYSLLTGTIPTWNQNTTGNAATATTATTANSATTATTATKLANARTINGVAFDGTTDITITGTGSGSSDASTLTGTTLASNVVSSSLTSVGNLTAGGVPYSLLTGTIPTWNQNTTGNAATATTATTANSATTATTATKLANARTINGVAFDGTADITITGTGSGSSDAGTLTGTTLASNVVSSSLTSVGTISSGTWNGTTIALTKGGTGATTAAAALTNLGAEPSITAGNTSQYFRGDKTFQTLDKATISLGNVDNTSDANKPVSSATQTALNAKEDASNKSIATDLGGVSASDVSFPSQKAVKSYVDSKTTDASTLTGTTLASNVVSSSLTSVGTISSGTWNGTTIAITKGGTGATTAAAALTNLDAEPSITAGTTSQYFRGDKTFQTLDKTTISLGNVDNTSDANKPVSTATQTALNAKEDASNKSIATDLGGVSASDVSFPSQKAVKSYVDSKTTDASTLTGTTLASGVVSSSLTSVGTISTGTWNANTISVSKGGTGATNINGLLRGNGTSAISTAAYGSFYDTSTQTILVANTAYPMEFNTSDFTEGVSIENNLSGKPTRIKVSNTGKYNIQFSAQLDRSTGTSAEDVSIWIRKNESDVVYSCSDIAITGATATSAPTVASWNFFQSLNANEYIEFYWSASATNIIIKAQAPRTSPTRPGIPSLILTVQQVY